MFLFIVLVVHSHVLLVLKKYTQKSPLKFQNS
ncbi:hypothetical protein ACK1LH_06120 [Metabacillus indicus]